MSETINAGEMVICDLCNKDAQELPEGENMGGGMIGTYAICPQCFEESKEQCAREYPEELDSYEPFPKDKTFYQNVLELRKRWYGSSDLTITITAW
jgi:hypothetical protein